MESRVYQPSIHDRLSEIAKLRVENGSVVQAKLLAKDLGIEAFLQSIQKEYWQEGEVIIEDMPEHGIRISLTCPYTHTFTQEQVRTVKRKFRRKKNIRETVFHSKQYQTRTSVLILPKADQVTLTVSDTHVRSGTGLPSIKYFQNPLDRERVKPLVKADSSSLSGTRELVLSVGQAFLEASLLKATDIRIQNNTLPAGLLERHTSIMQKRRR